jgi:hypothetical protein
MAARLSSPWLEAGALSGEEWSDNAKRAHAASIGWRRRYASLFR